MKKPLFLLGLIVAVMAGFGIWGWWSDPTSAVNSQSYLPTPTANGNLNRIMDSADKVTAATAGAYTKTLDMSGIIVIAILAAVILITTLFVFQAGRTKVAIASVKDLNGNTIHNFIGMSGDGSNEVPQGAFAAAEAVGNQIRERQMKRLDGPDNRFLPQ